MDDVIKPRDLDELDGVPDPDSTVKKFLTLKPGITPATEVPEDFKPKSIFPSLRPANKASLAAMTKDMYVFTHCAWFSWGGMKTDPLVEFYMKDGESNKCVWHVPLKEKLIYGIARNANELVLEQSLFAVPRERMRDLLFWMDGVTVCEGGKFKWLANRQHLALNPIKAAFDDKTDTEYVAFYGCRNKESVLAWGYYLNGFTVGLKQLKPA